MHGTCIKKSNRKISTVTTYIVFISLVWSSRIRNSPSKISGRKGMRWMSGTASNTETHEITNWRENVFFVYIFSRSNGINATRSNDELSVTMSCNTQKYLLFTCFWHTASTQTAVHGDLSHLLHFQKMLMIVLNLYTSVAVIGFGGLGVVCWPFVPKFAGSNPAEAVGFLGWKNPQHAFLQRGSKAVGPMS